MTAETEVSEYSVKRGGRLPGGKAAARIVGAELVSIDAALDGISPQAVVERARTPGTPLNEWDSRYHYFQWDDTLAAEEYRRDQARSLIRYVKVSIEDGDQTLSTRGFWAVNSGQGRVYRPVNSVVANAEAHTEIITRFQNELVRIEEAYQAYLAYSDFANRFGSIFIEVDKFIDEMAAQGDVRAREIQRQRARRESTGVGVTT